MRRSDYSFAEESFGTTPLAAPPPSELQPLIAKLLARRVTVLTGAGASAGLPSGLPLGGQVAETLRSWALGMGMTAEVAGLNDPNDLGEVPEMVEDRFGQTMLINQLVEAADWVGTHFNLVHLAIALLFAEGFLRIGFTANWDRLAQRAAWTVAGLDLSCPCDKPTLAVAKPPLFVHMHGAADHPASLVATNTHLTAPAAIEWTQPQLAAAAILHELG